MPILYVLAGPDIGKTYELDHGAVLGRALECEATLRGTSISRKHARLEREGDVWTLYDLGSRNGLHVNGERVDHIPMEEGGTFHVGDLEMRFREAAQGVQLVRESATPEPEPDTDFEFGDFDDEESEFDLDEDSSDDDGIAFEGEDLFDQEPPPLAAQPAQKKPPVDPAPKPAAAKNPALSRQAKNMAAAGIRPPATGAKLSDGRPVLQFSKPKGSEGFFSNDLGQYPLPVRIAAGVVAIALFAGLFYFAYRSANTLKGRTVDSSAGSEMEAAE